MGKVMILAFSEDEEDVCQRMLQIISESPRFEGCNVLQVETHLNCGGMKLNLAEKNVIIHDAEIMLTNREFEILYLLAKSPAGYSAKSRYMILSGRNRIPAITVLS